MVGAMSDGCYEICLFVHYPVFISARAFRIFGIQYICIAIMPAAHIIYSVFSPLQICICV